MVAIHEYRIPLPFTIEEYEIAQLYMVAKYSASESTGNNGDGVEILKNEPFEEGGRRGQYTYKVYHLASKLPNWLVSLLPKKALILEEEAWNAYPHCTTVLKCPFLHKFKLILDSTHVADTGTSENALELDPKVLKKRQVEYIDIAMDQPEKYVAEEDPSVFRSMKTGRGPLLNGWQERCEPIMCAYKCVTVDVPYWGFGSRIEKFIAKNAQRKILLEGHRKCFCWLDEWFGSTMADIRRMEDETAETIRRARTVALARVHAVLDDDDDDDGSLALAVDAVTGMKVMSPMNDNGMKVLSPTIAGAKRRPSFSLVGPQFAVGMTTVPSRDVDDAADCGATLPSTADRSFSDLGGTMTTTLKQMVSARKSSEPGSGGEWEDRDPAYQDVDDQSSAEVSKCVDVLDRVIVWTKALRLRKSSRAGPFGGTGMVAPVDLSGEMFPDDDVADSKPSEVDQYIGVLNSALSAVKRKPSGNA